jgi:hypothetical protein
VPRGLDDGSSLEVVVRHAEPVAVVADDDVRARRGRDRGGDQEQEKSEEDGPRPAHARASRAGLFEASRTRGGRVTPGGGDTARSRDHSFLTS